jgi:hypothetical protein
LPEQDKMHYTTRFQPNWYEKQIAAGRHIDHLRACSCPLSPPKDIKDLVSSPYASKDQHVAGEATFTLFRKLPVELRRMIWRRCLPDSRIVEIMWDEMTGFCRSPCPLPIALSVNKESREVALGFYKLCFGISDTPAKVYFDMKVDQLYLGIGNIVATSGNHLFEILSILPKEELAHIKHLIFDEDIVQGWGSLPAKDIQLVVNNLQSITMIKNESRSMDCILNLVNSNPVELDLWRFDEDGRSQSWSCDIYEEGEEPTWAFEEESMTSGLEQMVNERKGSRTLSRYVTQERLKQEARWAKRMEFLQSTITWDNGCLYVKDGLIEKLVDMEELEPDKYTRLSILVSEDCEWVLDPQLLYASQVPCICPVGHKKKYQVPDWYPDVSRMDLRALLEKLSDATSS